MNQVICDKLSMYMAPDEAIGKTDYRFIGQISVKC